jgi:AcrR family transcriptional regulator
MAKKRAARRALRSETISRRAARARAERDDVIAAATDLFSSRGYHETSIRDIADHAGFSIGALYQRFESKDALYCEVVEKHYGQIWDAVDQAIAAHPDFLSRVTALTTAMFSHIAAHRTFLRLYELHAPTIAEPYQSRIIDYRSREKSRRALVDAFALGHREGLIGDPDADFLGTLYYGMLNRSIVDFLAGRRALPAPERLVRLFVKGAADGATPRRRTATRRQPAGRSNKRKV